MAVTGSSICGHCNGTEASSSSSTYLGPEVIRKSIEALEDSLQKVKFKFIKIMQKYFFRILLNVVLILILRSVQQQENSFFILFYLRFIH